MFHTTTLLLAAFFVSTLCAQVGASPIESSPEIVAQMKLDSRQGFTASERAEFKKLHAADAQMFNQIAVMLQEIANNSRRYNALEGLISGLDTTLDTRRLLMLHTSAILDLQKNERQHEEERKAMSTWFWGIASGILLLIVTQLLKWKGDGAAAERRNATLITQLIAQLEDTAELKSMQRHKALGLPQ